MEDQGCLGPSQPLILLWLEHHGAGWGIERVCCRPVNLVEEKKFVCWAKVGPVDALAWVGKCCLKDGHEQVPGP